MELEWSLGRRGVALVVVAGLVIAACDGGSPSLDGALGGTSVASPDPNPTLVDLEIEGTLPLAEEALDDPEGTTVASDLAPSQLAASTVPEPSTPPPCTLSDLELWTAQVRPAGRLVDAVIRVRNVSDQRCEPDIGRSPFLDPAIEPDVWLLPGGSADLSIGQMAPECAEPSLVKLVQLGIGEESVVVPTVVLTCGWWLDAFVPIEPIRDGCSRDQLAVVVVGSTVVVRNDSSAACGISGVVEADGAPLVAATPGIDARELAPGDVAMIGRSSGDACETPPGSVELVDEVAGVVVVEDVPCDVIFERGTARPWYGTASGPTAGLQAGVVDTDAALALLGTFAATQ